MAMIDMPEASSEGRAVVDAYVSEAVALENLGSVVDQLTSGRRRAVEELVRRQVEVDFVAESLEAEHATITARLDAATTERTAIAEALRGRRAAEQEPELLDLTLNKPQFKSWVGPEGDGPKSFTVRFKSVDGYANRPVPTLKPWMEAHDAELRARFRSLHPLSLAAGYFENRKFAEPLGPDSSEQWTEEDGGWRLDVESTLAFFSAAFSEESRGHVGPKMALAILTVAQMQAAERPDGQ